VAQLDPLLHPLGPKIEVSVLQPQLLTRNIAVIDLERKRRTGRKNLDLFRFHFDLAGRHLRIHHRSGTGPDHTGNGNAIFEVQ